MAAFLRINFLLALAGVLGSLYLSEVMKFPPCTLCWYQRICLYPLAAVFAVGLLTDDRGYRRYAAPLLAAGLILSLYHNLLYFGVIAQELVPCTGAVSCAAKQLELFGFLTIPLMSLACFAAMSLLVYLDHRSEKRRRDIHDK